MKLKLSQPRVALLTPRVTVAPAPSRAPSYRIRGRALQQIREAHLRLHPLCVRCLLKGFLTPGDEIDHIIPLSQGGTDTDDNRQTLCAPCHVEKGREDDRATG